MDGSDIDFSLDYCEAAAMSGHFDDAEAILKRLDGHRARIGQARRANHLGQVVASLESEDRLHPKAPKPPMTADKSLYDRITAQ